MHCCINIRSCYEKLIHYLFKKQFSEMKKKKEKIRNRANFGSSRQRCSIKKGVLKNFTTFTGKHLCLSLFFNKLGCFWKQTGTRWLFLDTDRNRVWILLIFLNLKSVKTCFIVVVRYYCYKR